MDELMSMDQIASRLGVQPSTVRHWRIAGRLPEPDLVHGPRRLLWRSSTIARWSRPPDRRRKARR